MKPRPFLHIFLLIGVHVTVESYAINTQNIDLAEYDTIDHVSVIDSSQRVIERITPVHVVTNPVVKEYYSNVGPKKYLSSYLRLAVKSIDHLTSRPSEEFHTAWRISLVSGAFPLILSSQLLALDLRNTTSLILLEPMWVLLRRHILLHRQVTLLRQSHRQHRFPAP